MLLDARGVPAGTVVETDVCIVGAGAAGITLAREFIGAPFRVCLLEGGGLDFDADIQDLYKGVNVGRDYYDLDVCRLRYFGGTTNHWAGWCRPFEPIDFERRRWVPYSGWPFGHGELGPFYDRARAICQLGPPADDAASGARDPWRLPLDPERVVALTYRFSPPTRFGEVYRSEIKAATNVAAYLHANVVDIETRDTAREVTRLRVATLGGNGFAVAARRFVLAAGGIENPRLLLAANGVQAAGLGNQHDLVGRFFMEHPELDSGLLLVAPSNDLSEAPFLAHSRRRYSADRTIYPMLTLNGAVQEREEILNCGIRLSRRRSFSDGWTALRRLVRPALAGEMPDQFMSNLRDVLADLDGVAVRAFEKVSGSQPPEVFAIESLGQQAPNPDSRITLGAERDALGVPRPVLDWRLGELDKRSIRRTLEIIGRELGRIGLGRVKVELGGDDESWPPQFYYANHHIGTTRMSTDPTRGVVDADCRVHGIGNLYVAGSSVFPTSGSAPPTLTIVALALRLADHIKGAMA